jgi:translation initiation factor IF-3
VYPNEHNRTESGPLLGGPTWPDLGDRVPAPGTCRQAGASPATGRARFPQRPLSSFWDPSRLDASAHTRSGPIATPVVNEPRINDRIRAREVRLVSAEGEQIGIKPLPEALSIARAAELDLVEVAPQANPPVCRIMDYGKYKYEAAQRAKESRRKTTQISIKEMKYRVKIGRGDFDTKTKKVEHFLEEGHKVKITIMFRGREVAHPELGMKILENVADQAKDLAKVEAAPKLDGRNMVMVLAPDKRVQDAARRRAQLDGAEADGALPDDTVLDDTVLDEPAADDLDTATPASAPSPTAEAEPQDQEQ